VVGQLVVRGGGAAAKNMETGNRINLFPVLCDSAAKKTYNPQYEIDIAAEREGVPFHRNIRRYHANR
jgi:hypothetical protein